MWFFGSLLSGSILVRLINGCYSVRFFSIPTRSTRKITNQICPSTLGFVIQPRFNIIGVTGYRPVGSLLVPSMVWSKQAITCSKEIQRNDIFFRRKCKSKILKINAFQTQSSQDLSFIFCNVISKIAKLQVTAILVKSQNSEIFQVG